MDKRAHSHKITTRLWRGLIWVITAVFLIAIAGTIYQTAATEADQRSFPPQGNLIDVGGFKMHIHCDGEGEPTVILDALSGGFSSYWAWVQPEVAEQVQVCAYDRAGFGWSENDPEPETPERAAANLHSLLTNAGMEGPFIMVGHSKGGLYVRQYAQMYPQEVAGLVLLDSSNPYQFDRYPDLLQADTSMLVWMPWIKPLMRMGVGHLYFAFGGEVDFSGLPARQHDEVAAAWSSTAYWQSLESTMQAGKDIFTLAQNLGPLGDLPLLVITRGTGLDGGWKEMQDELAALSTNSLHITIDGSTHGSLVFNQDHAHMVSEAILKMVEAARSGGRLAP